MAADDRTKRMPQPKTQKINHQTGTQASSAAQTALKRNSSAGKGGNNGNVAKNGKNATGKYGKQRKKTDKKFIVLIVIIIFLAAALALALCWGFGVFNSQEESAQDQTEQTQPESEPQDELPAPSGDATDITYIRYATGDISLEYPPNWSVMSYQGAQTVVVTRGTVADGFIKLGNASVSSYGAASVNGVSTMKSFVKAVADSENIQVNVDRISVAQRGSVWVASISMSTTIQGVQMTGTQLIAATGDTAYLVTAQCPNTTYQKNWPYFSHVLDSISFNGSADLPDEGRD